jgi:putative MATE family efflux protein
VTRSDRHPIAAIAVPVGIEMTLILALNFINQIVVGVLGATAIAAVGFANSITFIIVVTFGGLGTSVSILIARAYGGGRRDDLSMTLSVALLLGGCLAAVAAIVPQFVAEPLLHLMGAAPAVAVEGAGYFRVTALAMVPAVLITVMSSSLRSAGHARAPMIATFITVPLNTVLAYLLVLGIGPFPHLGVAGAGWATLITALLRTALLALLTYGIHRIAIIELPGKLAQWREIVRPLIVLALPLAVTEFFWTTGTFLYNVVFQRLGTPQLAAAQIAATMEGIFIVGSMGLMSATQALVGHSLGSGDIASVKSWIVRLKSAGIKTSLAFGALLALSAITVPLLFPHAGAAVWHAAIIGILINAAAQPIKVRNMILGAGVLPSGNDVRGVIFGDVVGAFVFGLPFAIVFGLFTPLAIVGVFLGRVVEELVKMAIFTARARKLHWETIAREHEAALAA